MGKKKTKRRWGKGILIFLIIIFIGIQFIPAEKTNPPVKNEPNWDSKKTREYAVRTCFDCHSNETKWPIYSYVAPVSWFIVDDVNHAREEFNMSEYQPGDGDEAYEEVSEGEMPMWQYVLLHPEADLSDKEKKEFINGLKKTFGTKEVKPEKEENKLRYN